MLRSLTLDSSSNEFSVAPEQWQLLINSIIGNNGNNGILDVIRSICWISQLNPAPSTAIFVKTTAEGTLMRRKLKPVTDSIFEKFIILLD